MVGRGQDEPWAWVFRPVDGAWLGAFRIAFGSTMCVSMLRFLFYGWVERFFVEPSFHFKYFGLAWIRPLPEPGMTSLFFAMVILAACVTAGFLFRLSAVCFALGLTYVQLIDVSTYLNHYYLAALLSWLLALSPAGKVWSVDRRLAKSRVRGDGVAACWLYLFRFQVGLVYLFAGLAKLNSDWLVHAQPLRVWLGQKTHLPIIGPIFTVEGVPLAMSWAGFLFDTTIVFWLTWRRSRPIAYAAVLGFHALTRILFPIGMFPVIMSVAALSFFEPDWPRRLLARTQRLRTALSPDTNSADTNSPDTNSAHTQAVRDPFFDPRRRKVLASVFLVYCALQVALPLRFLFYGGNVMWHEQGMRFSWRVMLRAKGGNATFVVYRDNEDKPLHVHPRRYLTDLQETEMVSQPDLILQLARHIKQDFESRGSKNVRVFVDSHVALNGRRAQALVDPKVDLSSQSATLGPFHWVTPAPEQVPHHTRPVL